MKADVNELIDARMKEFAHHGIHIEWNRNERSSGILYVMTAFLGDRRNIQTRKVQVSDLVRKNDDERPVLDRMFHRLKDIAVVMQ